MRNLIIIIFLITKISVFSQQNELLKYFSSIKYDSIITTRKMNKVNICAKFYENPVPDSITLKYFFNNDTTNMYYEMEDYSPDFDKWTSEVIKKTVCPFFYKKCNEFYLICYDISNIIYLSFYDLNHDTIISSYIVSDYTDEYGNEVTHSIIFPNNYIASVEIKWSGDYFYKLLKIDIDKKEFVLIKNIKFTNRNTSVEEVFKKTYQILGINEKGELFQPPNSSDRIIERNL